MHGADIIVDHVAAGFTRFFVPHLLHAPDICGHIRFAGHAQNLQRVWRDLEISRKIAHNTGLFFTGQIPKVDR